MIALEPRTKRINPFRAQKGERVTICAGFTSTFGVVICADSQETIDVMKFDAPKLIIKPSIGDVSDKVRMAFAGAGHGPFIDKLVEKMWEAANRGPSMLATDVFDRIEDANIEWHKKIWEVYEGGSRPEAEILIAIYTPNEVNLYQSSGPIISPVNSHAFIGRGGELATYMAENICDFDELEDNVSSGIYILENVKKYVESCGGDTQLAVIMLDGSIHKMSSYDAEVIAKSLERMWKEVGYLFSVSRSPQSKPVDVRRSARATAEEINQIRSELRKDVRKMIRVSPTLKKSLNIFYQRLSWPPTGTPSNKAKSFSKTQD
jgi:ATP-dependent protease HslVU (ClpYQ) peptidase subunit